MSAKIETPTQPVEDSVAKVDDQLAVGEDLVFQRRWWLFEKWVWRFFALLILLDLFGFFGRGPFAHAHAGTPDGALSVRYERVERYGTPSILTISLSPAAVENREVKLWVSSSVVTRLGNQRIIPQPVSSSIGDGGILYTFTSGEKPSSVAFALQPAAAGMSHFTIRLSSGVGAHTQADALTAGVFVMP